MIPIKITLYYPEWSNRWIPYILDELTSCYEVTVFHNTNIDVVVEASKDADILLSMWCDPIVEFWSNKFPHKKIISYLRRYEMWEQETIKNVKFENIDAMIFVSQYYKNVFNGIINSAGEQKRQYVIANGIDTSHFSIPSSVPEKTKIALIGSIKVVKNLPLAGQVLLQLPEEYTIHHIGLPFNSQSTGQVMSYLGNLGLSHRFRFEGHIPSDKVPKWLENKGCILSTSLNEGNPNCIIEAMAMGIKPVIHNWPGAKGQFPKDLIWNTLDEAVAMITSDKREPERYRQHVIENFSLDNFKKLHTVIDEVLNA